MKKIIITERQLKLLEDVQQYTSSSNEVKNFFGEINNSNIDVINYINSDTDIHDNTKLIVDWSVLFMFNEKGFNIKIKINRIYGKVIVVSMENNQVVKELNVDSNNGYKLDVNKYLIETDMNSDDFYLEIDPINKKITVR